MSAQPTCRAHCDEHAAHKVRIEHLEACYAQLSTTVTKIQATANRILASITVASILLIVDIILRLKGA